MISKFKSTCRGCNKPTDEGEDIYWSKMKTHKKKEYDFGGVEEVKEYHILSLGAGVQSTTVYLLAMDGALRLDAAIFADTGDEPKAVYKHLEWLQAQNGPPILVRSRGRLSDDLMRGENSPGQRFAAVPFFTKHLDGTRGQTRRQCSKEYKVEVVERAIRRDIVGLKPRQRIPKTVSIIQYFGISLDEARRTIGISKRVPRPVFPLIDRGWTRALCEYYLRERVPHTVPRSACVFCPYHSDREWLQIKQQPEDWALALRMDDALRELGKVVNRKMDLPLFSHASLKPLREVQFKHERQFNFFTTECDGVCGV